MSLIEKLYGLLKEKNEIECRPHQLLCASCDQVDPVSPKASPRGRTVASSEC